MFFAGEFPELLQRALKMPVFFACIVLYVVPMDWNSMVNSDFLTSSKSSVSLLWFLCVCVFSFSYVKMLAARR